MRALLRRSGRSSLLCLAAAGFAVAGATSDAHAAVIHDTAVLDGPSESPPNISPATGFATVDIDTVLHTMHVHADWTGLIGTTTASHIHAATAVPFAGTAGVATTTPFFAGFPIGVTSGTYDNILDMSLASSYNPVYMAAHGGTPLSAESDLFLAMSLGESYLNIHTTFVGSGEIRGFLVPAPGGVGALLAMGGLVAMRRRRA